MPVSLSPFPRCCFLPRNFTVSLFSYDLHPGTPVIRGDWSHPPAFGFQGSFKDFEKPFETNCVRSESTNYVTVVLND